MIHYLDSYLRNPIHPISVSVLGAGGTGSAVMTGLIRIHTTLLALGYKGLNVILFDGDAISEANVGRSNFFPADIGRNKAQVLIERINRTYGTEWSAITSNGVFCKNITISCTDSVESRFKVEEQFKSDNKGLAPEFKKFYWIDCGNAKDTGQVVLGSNFIKQPDKTSEPTIHTLPSVIDLFGKEFKDVKENNTPSCSTAESIAKQGLFTNQFIANYACQMLWQLLRYFCIDYNGIFFNLAELEIQKINL